MKDPQQAIRDAYLALLTGNVFTGGPEFAAEVYADFVPSDATRPYVFLSQQTVADGRTGNMCPSADTTILVEVVFEVQGKIARTSLVNSMASKIIDALSPLNERPTNVIGGGNWEVNRHFLESSNMLDESNGANVILRRLLRFRDLVFEREPVTIL